MSRDSAKKYIKMALADGMAAFSTNDLYSACFHCQQEIEKYLKAYLAYHDLNIPKTHNLTLLLEGCIKIDNALNTIRQSLEMFQPYAVEMRYTDSKPNIERDFPLIWGTASGIVKLIRQELPEDLFLEASQEMDL